MLALYSLAEWYKVDRRNPSPFGVSVTVLFLLHTRELWVRISLEVVILFVRSLYFLYDLCCQSVEERSTPFFFIAMLC